MSLTVSRVQEHEESVFQVYQNHIDVQIKL